MRDFWLILANIALPLCAGSTFFALARYASHIAPMRILVTGKNGQVGGQVSHWSRPGWDVVAVGREECDMSEPQSLRDLVRRTGLNIFGIKPQQLVRVKYSRRRLNILPSKLLDELSS